MLNKPAIVTLGAMGAILFSFYCYFIQGHQDKVISTALLVLIVVCIALWYIYMRFATKQTQLIESTDRLTELANRRTFLIELDKQMTNNGKPFAVILIDINNFGDLNNLHGSGIGDIILQKFAQRIKTCFDGSIFARIGGDEFAILVKDFSSKSDLEARIKRVNPVLQAPFYLDEKEFLLSANIGVAIFPDHGANTEDIMKAVGIACHKSKSISKGFCLIYDPEMNEQMIRRMRIQNDISRSLNNNEFLLYYQPQIDTISGKIVAVEALIRWDHPEMGRISPIEFIPIAEKSGAILALDEWVFRAACQQSVAWRGTEAKDLRISVNFSMQQFKQYGIIPMVLRVINETGADLTMMNIEITETTFMQNVENTISILNQLKRLDVTISVDDFGTGYSSLSYLRQLPITSLKLDKSFVDHMLDDDNGGFVAKSIISLAHDLNLEIIAEGVESESQLQFLKDLGCEKIQGYLFSPPITPEELEKIIKIK